MSQQLPVISVVGPTASGKSNLAIELALAFDGECINADSMQFYRGMDIGTAKITAEEMRGVPHHLLDILDVRQEASVAVFQQRARELFEEISSRGKLPILVGGSGLYVRAALDSLEFPDTNPQVRARLEQELLEQGAGALHRRLQEVDPDSAARINDDRRLVRALEVWEVTGRTFTSFMPRRKYVRPALQLGMNGERSQLHERINVRVEHMAQQGLLDEVRNLEEHGLREGKTASRAIGYREFLKVLDAERGDIADKYDIANAIEDTATATRQFARRQITWFNADPRVTWFDFGDSHATDAALQVVEKSLQNPSITR
ncbi:MAG: tRNA (adenosine(37)-N6)-dimethylallyltransferase MiaA [Rothia sp. (in: high G+C Gram-positive bacteria)]|nr:tRNA (adenosine(37)-N6)-dimethylallyltransferase MiaA [Rothia sp. (in: high G+C Gram-positive bacteria)]